MRLPLLCAAITFLAISAFAGDPATTVEAGSGRRRAIRLPAPCIASFEVSNPKITDVATDDRDVYFGDMDGIVWRAAKSGAAPAVVAQVPGSWVILLTIDAANVYVLTRVKASESDSIYVVPKGGGELRLLIDRLFLYELLSDGEWLYVVNPGTVAAGSTWNPDGRVLRVRISDAHAETLASSLHGPAGLWLDGETLYFSERGTSAEDVTGGIRRMSKSGGEVENVATIPGAMTIHGDSERLYTFRLTRSDAGALEAVSKSDGSVTRLVDGVRFDVIAPLVAYGGWLYFGTAASGNTGRIEAINPATAERKIVAEVEGGFPQIAVDECGVYYSTSSALMRASR